jgi:hypothetical protein
VLSSADFPRRSGFTGLCAVLNNDRLDDKRLAVNRKMKKKFYAARIALQELGFNAIYFFRISEN